MISGADILRLSQIFSAREAKLYHACQYRDFCSYLALGGIPSRSLLEARGMDFTPFQTDARDHQNGVWDKVFVNLHDFGKSFANGGAAVPNTFGPIMFVMRSDSFSFAQDVAICMRSAGAANFNRERESISIEDVEYLFVNPLDSPHRNYVKFGNALQDRYPGAHNPEVSCTIPDQLFPLGAVAYIVVDPYITGGVSLGERVSSVLRDANSRIRVYERNTPRQELYNEILAVISNGTLNRGLAEDMRVSANLRGWVQSVGNIWYQVERFSSYLSAGTIQHL